MTFMTREQAAAYAKQRREKFWFNYRWLRSLRKGRLDRLTYRRQLARSYA